MFDPARESPGPNPPPVPARLAELYARVRADRGDDPRLARGVRSNDGPVPRDRCDPPATGLRPRGRLWSWRCTRRGRPRRRGFRDGAWRRFGSGGSCGWRGGCAGACGRAGRCGFGRLGERTRCRFLRGTLGHWLGGRSRGSLDRGGRRVTLYNGTGGLHRDPPGCNDRRRSGWQRIDGRQGDRAVVRRIGESDGCRIEGFGSRSVRLRQRDLSPERFGLGLIGGERVGDEGSRCWFGRGGRVVLREPRAYRERREHKTAESFPDGGA